MRVDYLNSDRGNNFEASSELIQLENRVAFARTALHNDGAEN